MLGRDSEHEGDFLCLKGDAYIMVRKFLACLVVVVLWCTCAFADWMLNTAHRSITDFVNGKPDYTNARFLGIWSAAADWSGVATQEDVNLTGSMTFSGGNYSFWNGRNGGMLTNSGTQRTFGLASTMDVGGGLVYMPTTAMGDYLVFCLSADDGLNGVNVSWNFPDKPSYNRQAIFPDYMTTQEQLELYVPYVEYISSGSQVTGLRWRVVNPNNTSEAVTFDFNVGFRVFGVWDVGGYYLYANQWEYIEAGNPVSGEVTFDSPINEADIQFILAAWNYGEGSAERIYQWYFCKPSEPETWLYENHTFNASLVNGKSDYSKARFVEMFFDVQADESIIAEARHFMTEGSLTIPGGGYTLGNNSETRDENIPGEVLETIPAGTDKAFTLKMRRNVAPGDTYLEYQPIDENGVLIDFRKDAETNLPGRTITWTFPTEPSLNGSATISSFKSTAQQLAEGVPYIELVSADGKLTAVNFRMVTSSDTSRALALPYRTNFRIRFGRISPDVTGYDYWSNWMYNTSSGTWTLDEPQDLSNMDSITVRYRTWENSEKSARYQWQFYPASADPKPTPTSPDVTPTPTPDPTPTPSALVITTTTLPSGTTGTPYSTTLTANSSGVIWSLISGTLPAGLTLSSSGTISGTPTTSGSSSFTVRATSGSLSAEKSLSITVNPPKGSVGSSGGGCEAFAGLSGFIVLVALFRKLHHSA